MDNREYWALVEYVSRSVSYGVIPPADLWIETVAKALLDLREQGVELEVPATPHVPYLDAN